MFIVTDSFKFFLFYNGLNHLDLHLNWGRKWLFLGSVNGKCNEINKKSITPSAQVHILGSGKLSYHGEHPWAHILFPLYIQPTHQVFFFYSPVSPI